MGRIPSIMWRWQFMYKHNKYFIPALDPFESECIKYLVSTAEVCVTELMDG